MASDSDERQRGVNCTAKPNGAPPAPQGDVPAPLASAIRMAAGDLYLHNWSTPDRSAVPPKSVPLIPP